MEGIKLCLVTGASGFIGRVLCEKLQACGIKVRALLRRPLSGPWDEITICDLENLERVPFSHTLLAGVDVVFHLAGIAHTELPANLSSELYRKVNVKATEALLNLVGNNQVRHFIYLSSVYAIDPSSDYGWSKKAAEEIVLQLGKKYTLPVTILRPALVYGPALKGNLLKMLRGIDRFWFPPLPYTRHRRSLISVEDVVGAAILVVENPKATGKIYTITDGHEYYTRQLYDSMREALGLPRIRWAVPFWLLQIIARIGDWIQRFTHRRFPFTSTTLEKLLGPAYYPSHLIQEELGWVPQESFFSVLPAIIRAYRAS